MMSCMEWLVSAGLLVAVAAWVAGVCHRLQLLRTEVRAAWAEWLADTHRRNEHAEALAESVSVMLPPGEMLPRTLRRLVSDSELVLRQGEQLLWSEEEEARRTEDALRREACLAARRVEENGSLRADERLWSLCEQLLRTLERQEQSARRFNLVVETYNTALREPPVQLLAPSLGFGRCAHLMMVSRHP